MRPIVAFGDSYTEGWGARPEEAYPAVMARALGQPVVNAGWRGETAAEALPRLERDVLRHAPRLVVVGFGANEAFRGYPVAAAAEGLGRILDALTACRIPAVLVGVHFAGYQGDFDAALRTLAEKHRAELLTGALDGILEDPSLRSDPHHPNARGYAILAERVLPVVQRALTRLSWAPRDPSRRS